ncbi:SemiSWEET transporter [Parvularcula sp. ZS-1/3]|uniref:SemiSWEET transporter n=1 Tax=Parvularcula mediterranea TaxID=2732508 RepID=A0A7Y3RKM3_9PROT|nr:SemiSWEET transporter [Parvularcula mediterranea]NNU15808.1 SemiSWEET transporter [Parvularcula mediterranea]
MLEQIFVTLAAVLTTASFIPQAVKVLQTKETEGLSATMYTMFTVGVGFWLLYGIVVGSWQIIIANTITLTLASIILFMKLRAVFGASPKP